MYLVLTKSCAPQPRFSADSPVYPESLSLCRMWGPHSSPGFVTQNCFQRPSIPRRSFPLGPFLTQASLQRTTTVAPLESQRCTEFLLRPRGKLV